MFTVKKFLELPTFSQFKIIAGIEGLDNVITGANIMDNPDALDWFSPGELLLTSGYFFRDSSELQDYIVNQLVSINCPALCIKPKQYLGQIPENMILLANEKKLPLIELPYGMSFSKILDIIRGEISENYDIVNRKSLDIHKAFFDISIKGGGISNISESLAKMIANPVIFMDKYFVVIDVYDIKENQYPIDEFVDGDIDKTILNQDYIESLPIDFEQLQKPLARQLVKNQKIIDTVLVPVFIQNIHYGYILVWNTSSELTNIDYITLEHSTMSFALERIRNNELERTKHRVRRDFLHDLFMGNIKDEENLKYLSEVHRINMNLSYIPMIVDADFNLHEELNYIDKKRYEDEKILEILKHLDKASNNSDFIIHSLSIQGQIIILLGFSKENPNLTSERLREFSVEIIKSLEEKTDTANFFAGIGGISNHLMDLHYYYNQALEALRLAKKSLGEKKIRHFNDFVVDQFIEKNIDEIKRRKFLEQSLGGLFKYDEKNNTDLILTLSTWIEHNYNISKTSRHMFTHRNTILYRLEKISSILNVNLEDSDDLLKLHLAIKIYRLLKL